MSVWDKFNKLKTFKIMFHDRSDAKNAEIFGNGINQVKILIRINIESTDTYTDKGKTYHYDLDITDEELNEVLSLITYQTGEKISRNNGKSSVRYWNSSTSASAFSAAFGYDMFFTKNEDAASSKSGQDFIFYVSAADFSADQDIEIAAEIDIPGVGVFNTTSQGTDTINGSKGTMSGSVFKMPAYVHVHARTKIDYSEKKNLFLRQSSWAPAGKQTFTVHGYKSDSKYWIKENGASLYQSIVEVYPGQKDTLKFISVEFSRDNLITSKELLDGKAIWHHKKEDGILLTDNRNNISSLSAMEGFGKNVNHPDYDVYFWGKPDSDELKGFCHLADSVWQYKVDVNIPFKNISGGGVSIVGHKISIPTGKNVYSNHWNGKSSPAVYSVVDNYGNKGTFKINFFVDRTHYENLGKVDLG